MDFCSQYNLIIASCFTLALSTLSAFDGPITKSYYQLECMKNFLDIQEERSMEAALERRRLLLPNHNVEDVCSWNGIICNDSARIISIHWGPTMQHTRYNLAYFPGSLVGVFIEHKDLHEQLSTRYIPKHVEIFAMRFCRLTGQAELQCLPSKMKEINLRANALTGKLNLLELPRSLEKIDVVRNFFSKVIVSSGMLPEEFIEMRCSNISIRWVNGKKDERIVLDH